MFRKLPAGGFQQPANISRRDTQAFRKARQIEASLGESVLSRRLLLRQATARTWPSAARRRRSYERSSLSPRRSWDPCGQVLRCASRHGGSLVTVVQDSDKVAEDVSSRRAAEFRLDQEQRRRLVVRERDYPRCPGRRSRRRGHRGRHRRRRAPDRGPTRRSSPPICETPYTRPASPAWRTASASTIRPRGMPNRWRLLAARA
jgi:hypothetical protein